MLVLSPNATLYNKDGVTDANNRYDDCADYISALKNIELVFNNASNSDGVLFSVPKCKILNTYE